MRLFNICLPYACLLYTSEVVQLYLGDPVCSVVRPLKELKHSTKVEVEPDETVQVEFVITPVSYTNIDVYKRQVIT